MKLYDFMVTPELAGAEFRGPSWSTWRVIARLIDGDAALLTADEQALALRLTGRTVLPTAKPREVYVGAGRRGGKSRFGAVVSAWLAASDYPQLSAGETAVTAFIAPDRRQASIDLAYCRGLIEDSALLRAELANATADSLEFRHRTMLEVATASYRTVRGRTLAGAVLDEAAFMRLDDSALPDLELARALRPALLTLNGLLLVISSPHRKVGLLYDAFKRYYGNDTEQRGLFIQAPSNLLNPVLDEQAIAEAMQADPEAARSEYLAEFRADISGYLSDELIDAALAARPELESSRFAPVAFADLSGGRFDASALAIAHGEQRSSAPLLVALDHLEYVTAPHEPRAAVERFCATLKTHGLHEVVGDRYAGEWVPAAFRDFGITYKASELSASEIYGEALPLFTGRRVRLIDDARLVTELRLLERKPSAGGRPDVVDHPRGAHDDCAVAACGALHLASLYAPLVFSDEIMAAICATPDRGNFFTRGY